MREIARELRRELFEYDNIDIIATTNVIEFYEKIEVTGPFAMIDNYNLHFNFQYTRFNKDEQQELIEIISDYFIKIRS